MRIPAQSVVTTGHDQTSQEFPDQNWSVDHKPVPDSPAIIGPEKKRGVLRPRTAPD